MAKHMIKQVEVAAISKLGKEYTMSLVVMGPAAGIKAYEAAQAASIKLARQAQKTKSEKKAAEYTTKSKQVIYAFQKEHRDTLAFGMRKLSTIYKAITDNPAKAKKLFA